MSDDGIIGHQGVNRNQLQRRVGGGGCVCHSKCRSLNIVKAKPLFYGRRSGGVEEWRKPPIDERVYLVECYARGIPKHQILDVISFSFHSIAVKLLVNGFLLN